MADSITVANLPAGFDLYGAYVDGRYQSYHQATSLYPTKVVGIAVFSTTDDGIVGDCENGDMTPQTAVTWVQMRRKAGVDPTIYCSEAALAEVAAAFTAAKVSPPHYWIAAYPGIGPDLYPGTVAHQWVDHGPYDESVVANYWPGVDPTPVPPTPLPQPTTPEDDMADTNIVVQVNGDARHVFVSEINDATPPQVIVHHWDQSISGSPNYSWQYEKLEVGA